MLRRKEKLGKRGEVLGQGVREASPRSLRPVLREVRGEPMGIRQRVQPNAKTPRQEHRGHGLAGRVWKGRAVRNQV